MSSTRRHLRRIAFGRADARVRRPLALTLLAAASAVLAIVPAAASAASLTPADYIAGLGETNSLTVTDNGTTLTFSDPGAPITASGGCLPAGANLPGTPVVCAKNNILVIDLDDGNDQTTFVGPVDIEEIDQYGGSGNDTLRGPSGSPTNFLIGESGADTLVGGAGSADVAYYGTRVVAVNVSINDIADDGEAGEGDNVRSGVEQVTAGTGNDTITGSAADNVLLSRSGNDTIDGGGGDDTVDGGAGADMLAGGDGNDTLYPGGTVSGVSDGADTLSGGPGVDFASVSAEGPGPAFAPLPVSVSLNDVADDGIPGEGDNYHSDIEDLYTANGGNDTLVGNATVNLLTTSAGNDSITGGAGNDILRSAGGNDTLDARDGYADRVDCGPGADVAVVDTLDQVSPNCETVQIADVGNANDTPEDAPPTVAFVTPAEDASVPGRGATVTVNAADDHGVARVVLIDDGRVVATDATAPYVFGYRPLGSDLGPNTLIAQAVDGRNQTSTATRRVRVGRFDPERVTATVLPARDRTRPFRFRVSGAARRPAGVTAAQGCTAGTVTITVSRVGRTVARRRASLRRTCTYAAFVTVGVRGRLTIRARFGGNRLFNARSSASRSVRAG